MRGVLLGIALVVGCYRPEAPSEVPCALHGDCPGSQQCDFSRSPPTCVGELAGAPAADAARDAPGVDAELDAAAPPPPSFSAASFGHDAGVASLTYRLAIPPGVHRYLLVSVQLGTGCGGATPLVLAVSYGGIPLTPIASVVGTPCGTNMTRSEEWQLIAPPEGLHDVAITLASTASTIHSSALAFVGIDQIAPVRATATERGDGASAMLTVTSQAGDLVVSIVGQGDGISAPGAGQTQRVLDNVDSRNTLNNSATSTAPGSAPSATMTWTFKANDEWQMIATSLQP